MFKLLWPLLKITNFIFVAAGGIYVSQTHDLLEEKKKEICLSPVTKAPIPTENLNNQEQDKSSDIEQQPPFDDRKISNIQPRNRGGGSTKPTGTSYNYI